MQSSLCGSSPAQTILFTDPDCTSYSYAQSLCQHLLDAEAANHDLDQVRGVDGTR